MMSETQLDRIERKIDREADRTFTYYILIALMNLALYIYLLIAFFELV